jgi:GT2 family glycosyltransferase
MFSAMNTGIGESSLDISVILPTRGRSVLLARTLRRLASQSLGRDRYEVLVGLDGPDEESEHAAAWVAAATGAPIRVVPCARLGIAGVKNELLGRARARSVLFINDDIIPERGFLEAHAAAQAEALTRTGGAMALGDSRFVPGSPDSAMDRLVRETSMVFFYDRMDASGHRDDRWHDWGFRHAWNLNLSAPREAVLAVGGFTIYPNPYGYEDLDLAWRLSERFGMAVVYRPEAVAPHEHAYSPEDYLLRELRLGYAAVGFAQRSRGCALATFRRDALEAMEVALTRQQVHEGRGEAERLAEWFMGLGRMDGSSLTREDLDRMYRDHLPLKRWCWRRGFVAAAEGQTRTPDLSEIMPRFTAAAGA